jgi:hypothetical protein
MILNIFDHIITDYSSFESHVLVNIALLERVDLIFFAAVKLIKIIYCISENKIQVI